MAQSAEKPNRQQRKRLPLRRKVLYAFLASTVIPLVFVVLVEVGLRLAGYGYPTDFFVDGPNGDYFSNRDFGQRYFPKSVARQPDFARVPLTKSEDAFRVFVLGGSAAEGYPDASYGFSRVLSVMLQEAYPNRAIEVVNCGMSAINSHVVREIAKDCMPLDPDLLVVYMGNNEVVGPYGPGTVFHQFSASLALIRGSAWVRTTRIGQLLNSLSEVKWRDAEWEGMAMFVENRIHPQDARLTQVYDYFGENLTDICRFGYSQNVPVIVCTVGSNLRNSPPFATMHRPGWTSQDQANWDTVYKAAVAAEAEEEYDSAIADYEKALQLDEDFAELHFRLGRCYWALGRYEDAQLAYTRARECDALRFRADTQINEVIRGVAAEHTNEGVHLLDVVAMFGSDEWSPHGVAGEELFHEHVHMNFTGNYAIAQGLFDLVSSKILPGEEMAEDAELTLEQCAERLALTAWNQQLIRANLCLMMDVPPFTYQLDHTEDFTHRIAVWKEFEDNHLMESAADAVGSYTWAIEKTPDDWMLKRRFAELLGVLEDYRAAGRYVTEILQLFPQVPEFQQWQRENIEALLRQASDHVADGQADLAAVKFRSAIDLAEECHFEDVAAPLQKRLRLYEQSGSRRYLDVLNRRKSTVSPSQSD